MTPHTHTKDWLDVVAAIGPLLAVVVAMGIGGVQLYLQQQQLKQDLFEKRFQIYSSARFFLTEFPKLDLQATTVLIERFIGETAHASALFGEDVLDLLHGALSDAQIATGILALDNHLTAEAFRPYAAIVKELRHNQEMPRGDSFAAYRVALIAALGKLYAVMQPYLRLYSRRNWFLRRIDGLKAWVDGSEGRLKAGRAASFREDTPAP